MVVFELYYEPMCDALCGLMHLKYLWIMVGQVVLAAVVTVAAMDASLHSKKLTWHRQNERMQHSGKSFQNTTNNVSFQI